LSGAHELLARLDTVPICNASMAAGLNNFVPALPTIAQRGRTSQRQPIVGLIFDKLDRLRAD